MLRPCRLATVLVLAAAGTVAAPPAGAQQAGASELANRLTAPQNAERELLGLHSLSWDPALAAAAGEYAAELARTGKWEHSSPDRRRNQGENLWMGTRAAFTPEQMVKAWLTEKPMFRGGTFPNVSTSGSWHDVGHYTQIIWPETSRVGCAVRSSMAYDYLVCRYSAPGNVIGARVGATRLATK